MAKPTPRAATPAPTPIPILVGVERLAAGDGAPSASSCSLEGLSSTAEDPGEDELAASAGVTVGAAVEGVETWSQNVIE